MAKELYIVFVYDTEVFLREEEDPQRAIVYFHPSWVSANRRMALCGQLMGVSQFLITDFSFPRLVSLGNGKFTMRKIGRFILCVGTDRNIPDWILTKRCEILHHTLQFFHANLDSFDNLVARGEICETLSSVMEIYLPVLQYPGNIFGNIPTIRLPKSGSSIFLEVAQLLESLQDHKEVFGGAIFYQNKVVMSQLSIDVTKQISITDPYRIKIPAKWISPSINIPAGIQLLTVYINDDELKELLLRKVPNGYEIKNAEPWKRTSVETVPNGTLNNSMKKTSRVLTLVEEECDGEANLTKEGSISQMPDIVKDTVKMPSEEEKKKCFPEIKVESFVVDETTKLRNRRSCSIDSLDILAAPATFYHSFRFNEEENALSGDEKCIPKERRVKAREYYNTISDPTDAWFRSNGLPASKALREDHISSYCKNLDAVPETLPQSKSELPKRSNKERPTNIPLKPNHISNGSALKSTDVAWPIKKDIAGLKVSSEVPLTPLMSKLSLMQVSDEQFNETLLTPAGSLRHLNDEPLLQKKKTVRRSTKKSFFRTESAHKATNFYGCDKHLTQTILFVFGYQNISMYLLLNSESEKNSELISSLWRSCVEGVKNLEGHFQQCFEGIPQTQLLNSSNDSYGYLHLHSRWDTLDHGGSWGPRHTEIVNTIREHFNHDMSLTDITVRFEDCVIYGNQTANNQTYYQQTVEHIAGLPTPSDPMGLISLKAKRRLERDYGALVMGVANHEDLFAGVSISDFTWKPRN